MNLAAKAGGCGYGQTHRRLNRQPDRPTDRQADSQPDRHAVQLEDRIDHRALGARPDRRTGRGGRPARNLLYASIPTAYGRVARRLSKPITRAIADPHIHGHSERCGHSGRLARGVRNPGWHIRANDCRDSRREAFFEGAHAPLKSDTGALRSTRNQSRLLWPPRNTRGNESDPEGRGDRKSDPAGSDSHHVARRRDVTDCHCVTYPCCDSRRGSSDLDDLGDTDRHAATNGRTHCCRDSVRDARRESDHAALKGGASAIRTAFDQSRFLRPPTRFATRYGGHSNGGGYARREGHLRGERDARRRIDGRRRDRPTHTRGPTDRIGDTARRNGSSRITGRADYSAGSQLADSLSARCPAIASSHLADGRRDSGLRRHESVSERSGVGDVKLIQLVGDRVEIAS
jgi:hypothetical protein